jgi:hypothetical protein
MGLGIFLARTCTEHKKFWAIVDMFWVSCWVLAVFFGVHEYSKTEKKVNHDFAIGRLSDLQDSIKIKASGLKKMYCDNVELNKLPKSNKQYCDALESLITSSSKTRMSEFDVNRSKKEFENLELTSELPFLKLSNNLSMTFDLLQYDKNYTKYKSIIETSVFDQQLEPLIRLTILSFLIIPFGLRFGKSYADYYRITKLPQIKSVPQPILDQTTERISAEKEIIRTPTGSALERNTSDTKQGSNQAV